MTEFNEKWAKCAAIRAIKTMAQTAVATIGTAMVMAQVDWKMVLSASVLAGILSLLTSVAGIPEADEKYEEDVIYCEEDEPEDEN